MQNGSKNMDTSIAKAMKLFNPLPSGIRDLSWA